MRSGTRVIQDFLSQKIIRCHPELICLELLEPDYEWFQKLDMSHFANLPSGPEPSKHIFLSFAILSVPSDPKWQNNFSTCQNKYPTRQNNFSTCQNKFPTSQNNFSTCQNYFFTCQNKFPTAKIIFPPAKIIFSPAKMNFPLDKIIFPCAKKIPNKGGSGATANSKDHYYSKNWKKKKKGKKLSKNVTYRNTHSSYYI